MGCCHLCSFGFRLEEISREVCPVRPEGRVCVESSLLITVSFLDMV